MWYPGPSTRSPLNGNACLLSRLPGESTLVRGCYSDAATLTTHSSDSTGRRHLRVARTNFLSADVIPGTPTRIRSRQRQLRYRSDQRQRFAVVRSSPIEIYVAFFTAARAHVDLFSRRAITSQFNRAGGEVTVCASATNSDQ